MRDRFLEDAPSNEPNKVLPSNYLAYLQTLSEGANYRQTEQVVTWIQRVRKEMEDAALENKTETTITKPFLFDDNDPKTHPVIKQVMDYLAHQRFHVESFPAKYQKRKTKKGEVLEKISEPFIRIAWSDAPPESNNPLL